MGGDRRGMTARRPPAAGLVPPTAGSSAELPPHEAGRRDSEWGAVGVAGGRWRCLSCGFEWSPRPPDHVPLECPQCRRRFGRPARKARPEIECPNCHHRWGPRTDRPAKCPRCFRWLDEVMEL